MAFFKFRKGGDDQTATTPPPESIEAMRKRARHRLIGAVVLVLLGVIGFPLLVDNQPRPIAVDIPIEIPDKNKVKPLVISPAPVIQPAASEPVTPVPAAPAALATGRVGESAPPAQAESGPKAQALPESKEVEKTAAVSEGRFVVQVGAFADASKAREARLKVERAGLKTYTQVVETREGQRTRVRVGPFASKAEAEQAAEKIKKLDLPAAILTL